MPVLPQCEVPINTSRFQSAIRKIEQSLLWLMLGSIRGYQHYLSPLLGSRCRFYPSCSVYAAESLRTYGILKGSYKTITRLCRCQPWHPGGVDLP